MKRKQKQILSLVVTSAMLFSTMRMTTAAEPIERDAKPTIIADTESDPLLAKTVKEDKDETAESKEETEGETKEETKEESGDNTGEGNNEDSDDNSEEESKKETEDSTEEGAEEESRDDTQEGNNENSNDNSEEGSGEETKEEPEDDTQGGNNEDSGDNTQEGNNEDSDDDTQEGNNEDSDDDIQEENNEDSDEEVKDDDLLEDPKDESAVDPENSGTKLPVVPKPSVHEHSWSVDWNCDETYHWHECDVEDCPMADDSEKDGYAEHVYDDYGICTDCGYDSMDGIALMALGEVPTYQEAYDIMIGLKDEYPEGMTWTNFEPYGSKGEQSAYTWKGGSIYGAKSAVGCMAFTFLLSDAVFDNLPARVIEKGNFTFEDVKIGDILRVNSNSHSVIILQKTAGGVIVAEGNYSGTVHWGRVMNKSSVEAANYIITRYPKDYVPSDDPNADELADSGTAGSLNWSLTNGGVLKISGNGAIPNYSLDNSPWSALNIQTIIIEDGVTSIGDYAFYQSEALSVYIPDSVKSIGQSAFRESGLVAVTIPGSVETIGNNAFRKCENLTSATVSNGVTTIGDSAFQGCMSLSHIDFPASIRSVGTAAFTSCRDMVSVRFMPSSHTVTLGDNLFSQCQNLLRVTLPQTADCISAGMFASCSSLSELFIPKSVQSIGENPLTACKILQVVYYEGSEEQLNNISNIVNFKNTLLSLPSKPKIVCNAVFDDPFADDPNDPGDFQPGEDEPCTNHVDADNDGKCDNCGKVMSTDTPGPDDGDEEDKTDPDGSGGGNKPPTPDNPGNDNKPPTPDNPGNDNKPPTSDSSGGSSGSSSDSSDESSDSNSLNGSGNTTISSTSRWESDGSHVTTKTQGDGTVITITTDITGKVAMEARLSMLGIRTAEKKNEAVTLPVSAVQVVKDSSMAPAITVYTEKDQLVKVAIPTVLPTSGTVALMVNEDGSTNIIPASVVTENNVVAFLPNGATVKIVDNSKSFSDVPAEAWFADAVSFIAARELFNNPAETTFAPGASMTYAMMTTALARLDGVQTNGGRTWYEKSMEWAAARGIKGDSQPNSAVTCEQMVTMLWKYQGSPVVSDTLSNYGDISQVSDTQKAMDWAKQNGIISVFGDGALDPRMQVNRSQAAQVIMDLIKKTTLHSVQ